MKITGITGLFRRVIKVTICLVILFLPLVGARGEMEDVALSRPGKDEGATKIYVALGLLDVDEIDTANQNFTANLFITARWYDPRLAHPGPGRKVVPLDEIWQPRLVFVNQQKIWPTLPRVAHISPDGEVEFRQRIWGPFSQPLDIRDFPFDHQDFEMRIASAYYKPDEISFEADPETPSGLAPRFSLPDWEILNWRLDFEPYNPLGSRGGVASYALIFNARRYVSNYLLKVILPLIMIVAMSCIVFWIDPKEYGTQIGVATTSMLTLIAYRFMVGADLPPVPYLTRIDRYILGCTFIIFAALIQAVVTGILAKRERVDTARRIDAWCRVIFPAAFAIVGIWSLVL